MERAPSAVRLLAKEPLVTGLATVAGAMWLVLLAGIALFPTPGGEDPLLLGIFGGMAALATAAWAAWALRRGLVIRRLLARGVAVSARVLRVDANAEHVHSVLLGYAFGGREYQTRSVVGIETPYRIADTVPLLVDPAAPSSAMIHQGDPGHARPAIGRGFDGAPDRSARGRHRLPG